MPLARLGDISIYYKVYGKGKPLLLIAGLGSDSSSWESVVKSLSLSFRVIVFDNRACGRSGAGRKKTTIRQMAEDALKLLDFLKIKNAHILGHSMGGYIAQEIAANYPKRVNKLILVSTALASSKKNNIFFRQMYKQLKIQGCSKAWIRRWAFRLFSKKLLADRVFITGFIKNAAEYPYAQKAQGFKAQIDAVASFDARDHTGAIEAKTLILEGKSDILITPKEVAVLAKHIRKSTFKLIAGLAHCIHIENPKLFTDIVVDFLAA